MWLSYLFAQQSPAPAINFVLGVSRKTKLQFTPLDKPQLLSPGAVYLLPQNKLVTKGQIMCDSTYMAPLE